MRFSSRHDELDERRVKPPPNYFQRSVQVRLLMLVFAFMLVVVLMGEARKAKNWRWIWMMTGSDPGGETQEAMEPVDTRLPPPPRNEDPPGTVYASQEKPGETTERLTELDGLQRVRFDAWRGRLKDLDHNDRKLLSRILRSARQRIAISQDDLERWRELFPEIDNGWIGYLTSANEAVLVSGDELPAEQTERLLNVLQELEVEWSTSIGRALRAPLNDRPWTELEIESLGRLQATLDELALADIRDDMVWRPAEQTAWFRIFEKLAAADERSLTAESVGEVGFVQLFRQPNEYRGRAVTVTGIAELAYHVQAPKNDVGVEGYYVFWLRPADGSDSPIVVYALETPEGFPSIAADQASLQEDVAFTGYFFKRWAYNARDGIRTAPLLLAKSPTWQAPASRPSVLPSPGLAITGVLAVALLAIAIAQWVYRSSNLIIGSRTPGAINTPNPQQFKALSEQETSPSVAESLRQLADDERNP
jgi:hypothetical protein